MVRASALQVAVWQCRYLGYWQGNCGRIDALLNASMTLSGEGPVDVLRTSAGKLFASFYALFSGVVFLAIAGILVAPVAHRLLHRLHLEAEEDDGAGGGDQGMRRTRLPARKP